MLMSTIPGNGKSSGAKWDNYEVGPSRLKPKEKLEKGTHHAAKSSLSNRTHPHPLVSNLKHKKIQGNSNKQEGASGKVRAAVKEKVLQNRSMETRVKEDQDQNSLKTSIDKFKNETRNKTLVPKKGVSDTDSDVYFYDRDDGMSLVIKPGESDARASVVAAEVLGVVGLNHTVPMMAMGHLSKVKAALDVDKEYVIKKDNDGKEFAIESDTLIPLKSNKVLMEGDQIADPRSPGSYFTVKYKQIEGEKAITLEPSKMKQVNSNEYENGMADGMQKSKSWIQRDQESSSDEEEEFDPNINDPWTKEDLEQEPASDSEDETEMDFQVSRTKKNAFFKQPQEDVEEPFSDEESWIDEFQGTPFKLMHDSNRSHFYLAPQEAMYSVSENSNREKLVMRNEYPYKLQEIIQSGVYEITGTNVPALYQEKIVNRFVGKGEDGLDVTRPSKEREAFYEKVHRQSFVESFVSFMLTRSHDGKIESLKNDSNFLFEEMENRKLKVRQIDLDSVMPPSNEPESDDEPHPIRCGLMGFPLVDEELSGPELEKLKEILYNCVSDSNQQAALTKIEMFDPENAQSVSTETSRRKDAYLEVINRIKEFLETNPQKATLKSLFYHVFPSYQRHFELLLNQNVSPQRAALQVGAEPLSRLL